MNQIERLCNMIKEHDLYVNISLEPGDDICWPWTDEVAITCGDSNCHHRHRFDPKTGHGFTHIIDIWQQGDHGQDVLKRALDCFEELQAADYDCEPCREILAGKREYNR